jgi:hypothetical protein
MSQTTITLGELLAVLPQEAQDAIMNIANSDTPWPDTPRLFKPILAPHAEALLAKGVVADYMAYVILPRAILQARAKAVASN